MAVTHLTEKSAKGPADGVGQPGTVRPHYPGPMSLFETVSVDQIPADAAILDVREQDEWELGRAAGAIHLPLGQLPERIDELDPDTDYYVICRSGGRSARAADFLVGRGYSALNVAGGSGAWLEAGKPMEADGDATPTVK